jgi:DNA-binding SARP family transcriptional activator
MSYPELTLRLFDRFEAMHADQSLPGLNLREGERLLAYLTLNAGQPIPYHTLAEQFWPGEARLVLDGSGDLASTRQAIRALRAALGPNEVRLTSPRKGVLLLDLTDADVDLCAFDRLATTADLNAWRKAVALHRGPLLQDWPEPWARNARKQREREYHRLLQRLLDAAVNVGDVVEQERWLRGLLTYAPTDEAVTRQLTDLLNGTQRHWAGTQHQTEPVAPVEEVRLEPIGGAVGLESAFYIVRPTDSAFYAALEQRDSIVLVHGARQMGKTSLLARGLNRVRQSGARVLLTDFQSFSEARFASPETLYLNLAANLAAQQEVDFSARDEWSDDLDANLNFEMFLRKRILAVADTPVVWGMDEVDRLFAYPYASEVFGLLRSWHNRRALDPAGPWSRLTLAIGYSTEAHLFIKDNNQSPFNVGTRIMLSDFSRDEVAELNRRYGSPLQNAAEIDHFQGLMGGHPYLSRAGLNAIARTEYTLSELADAGRGDGGPFRDHLRRLLSGVQADPMLVTTLRAMLDSATHPTLNLFYRLRSAGLLHGGSPDACRIRCQLYADYFAQHL